MVRTEVHDEGKLYCARLGIAWQELEVRHAGQREPKQNGPDQGELFKTPNHENTEP